LPTTNKQTNKRRGDWRGEEEEERKRKVREEEREAKREKLVPVKKTFLLLLPGEKRRRKERDIVRGIISQSERRRGSRKRRFQSVDRRAREHALLVNRILPRQSGRGRTQPSCARSTTQSRGGQGRHMSETGECGLTNALTGGRYLPLTLSEANDCIASSISSSS